MAKITIDGKDVEISNESMAELRASLLPNGEQLIRDLEPGEYEICGKPVEIRKRSICSDTDISTIPANGTYFSWIEHSDDVWTCQGDFESYIGKFARDITAADIVRIEPKAGTALLDELEPGTLVAINGVKCCVMRDNDTRLIIGPVFSYGYKALRNLFHDWKDTRGFERTVNKPVADLVASDIVQLYPKDGEA